MTCNYHKCTRSKSDLNLQFKRWHRVRLILYIYTMPFDLDKLKFREQDLLQH